MPHETVPFSHNRCTAAMDLYLHDEVRDEYLRMRYHLVPRRQLVRHTQRKADHSRAAKSGKTKVLRFACDKRLMQTASRFKRC